MQGKTLCCISAKKLYRDHEANIRKKSVTFTQALTVSGVVMETNVSVSLFMPGTVHMATTYQNTFKKVQEQKIIENQCSYELQELINIRISKSETFQHTGVVWQA